MSELGLFPYPHVLDGKQHDGSLRAWSTICDRCSHRQCEHAEEIGKVGLCSYGFNYVKLSPDLLVASVVLEGWNPTTQARRKRLHDQRPIPNWEFDAALASYGRVTEEEWERLRRQRREAESLVLDAEQFHVEYLERLKPEILRGLSFVHDYKQVNAQITQNINVVIEQRYEGTNFEAKLAKATRAEVAIYYAAKFLEEKLNVAKFLVTPEWLTVESECRVFRLHGLVTKYVRIYQSQLEAKHVEVKISGVSYGEVEANPQACAVIPHTLLDNAVKYAPPGSRIEVRVTDQEGGALLSVSSYGPRISEEERETIFRPFSRGEAAVRASEEGAGYGLYVSQLVAEVHLGTRISVEQDESESLQGCFWTTFTVFVPDRASILQ